MGYSPDADFVYMKIWYGIKEAFKDSARKKLTSHVKGIGILALHLIELKKKKSRRVHYLNIKRKNKLSE